MTIYNYTYNKDEIPFGELEPEDVVVFYWSTGFSLGEAKGFDLELIICYKIMFDGKQVKCYYGMANTQEVLWHGKKNRDPSCLKLISEFEEFDYTLYKE